MKSKSSNEWNPTLYDKKVSFVSKYGEDLLSKDYKNVIAQLFEIGFNGEIDNDDYVHALYLTDLMFQNTSRSLRMVMGSYGKEFLGDLHNSFMLALERIHRNHGFAHLAFLTQDSLSPLQKLQEQFRGTLKIFICSLTRNVVLNHIIICDNRMLRKEKPHPTVFDGMPVEDIKASVFLSNRSASEVAAETFDVMWHSLSRKTKESKAHQ